MQTHKLSRAWLSLRRFNIYLHPLLLPRLPPTWTSTRVCIGATLGQSRAHLSIMAETTPSVAQEQVEELPKLSAAEFRVYNSMAEHMEYFHNRFRQNWKVLYGACSSGKRPNGMSIRQFLSTAEQFAEHLTMHHTIEEMHIFPVLATKMPAFRKELELLTQHKQIHNGLDKFEDYVRRCRSGETDLRMDELKTLMDGFGDVLWAHLDDEVKQLGAENMRKYWSPQEMKRMPM